MYCVLAVLAETAFGFVEHDEVNLTPTRMKIFV
jgi:hypothetical protein